jgi:uncharacterized membrane protein
MKTLEGFSARVDRLNLEVVVLGSDILVSAGAAFVARVLAIMMVGVT